MGILEKLGIDLSTTSKETRGFLRGTITEYARNVRKFKDPTVQKYFHTLIAAIMLEYHKAYETYEIIVPYRIKAPKSVFNKVLEYMTRDDKSEFSLNDEGELQGKLREELSDMFAITIVASNKPSTFYSHDPEIKDLIEEKKRNQVLLGELQKLKLQITKKEFSGTEEDVFNFKCSRKDYYMMSIMTIERIKTLIHPNATKLLERYDKQLEEIRSRVPERFFEICQRRVKEQNEEGDINTGEKFQEAMRSLNTLIRYADLSEEETQFLSEDIDEKDVETSNFLGLLDDYTARIYDKLDLAVLSKQIDSVFDNSTLIKRFGVSLDKERSKEKRTERGYVANFLYLNTPFGPIEMQLQTEHENQEGNYGYAAHSSLNGKKFKEFELPDIHDKKAMEEFRLSVDFITPKKFLAQFDRFESNRIITQKFGEYQNYKALISQVKKGSEDDRRLQKYFAGLYSQRDKYFPDEDKSEAIEGFIRYDLEEYLDSPEFSDIMSGEFEAKMIEEGERRVQEKLKEKARRKKAEENPSENKEVTER